MAKRPSRAQPATVSDLETHLGYWLRFVSNHVSHAFRRKVEAQGVTVSEWVILRELLRLEPVSPGELARGIGMTKGAISKLVERLRSKSLLEREVSEDDRRLHTLRLSAAGRGLVPVLASLADRNDDDFFQPLDASERAQVKALMQRLVLAHRLKAVPLD